MLTTAWYTIFLCTLPDPQCSLVLECTKFILPYACLNPSTFSGRFQFKFQYFMNWAFFGFCTRNLCGKSASFCLNPQ